MDAWHVTFQEAEAAIRACLGPYPVIDGRRANCNLACLEVQGATTKTPASILSFKGCVLPRVVPSHRHNELPCNPASALRHYFLALPLLPYSDSPCIDASIQKVSPSDGSGRRDWLQLIWEAQSGRAGRRSIDDIPPAP